MTTLDQVVSGLRRDPGELLIRRWNWKSALASSILRSIVFLVANLRSGWDAALGAMLAEFIYRAIFAGFYGALTQSFRRVEPYWKGAAAAVVTLVLVSHSVEFAVHWLRGTPNLWTSIGASFCFTVISTLFNVHVMRRGVLITGEDARSLLSDFRLLPGLLRGERAPR
ncbi:MAG: hypothetical protein ACKV2U_29525 [Bryobacteraceae bacterium]